MFVNMCQKRRLASYGPQVQYIGRIKTAEQRPYAMYHNTINFIFIFSPQEEIQHTVYINGKLFKTQFPILEMHMPGCFYENRKNIHLQTDEMYISYAKSSMDFFKNILSGFKIDCSSIVPPYNIVVTPLMTALIENIRKITEGIHTTGNADRLDRLCECLILEGLLNRKTGSKSAIQINNTEEKVKNIAALVEISYWDADIRSLISQNGLSQRTFFREWKKMFPVSPRQHIIRLKLDHASSMLKFSKLKIKEIAEKVHFNDSFHFSKIFTAHYGVSPTEYRSRYWSKIK